MNLYSLQYLPLLIHLKCREDAELPEFLGSTLHGIIGWTLKSHTQSYQKIFENSQLRHKEVIPNPYFIDPPPFKNGYRQGDDLWFQFSLLGNAVLYVYDIISAMENEGLFYLGARRNQFCLVEILHGVTYQPILQHHQIHMEHADSSDIWQEPLNYCTHCSLQLLTPLRIRRNGQTISQISFPVIIRNIVKRLEELTKYYGGSVNKDALELLKDQSYTIKTISDGIYMEKMNRYSSRRQEKIEFNGLLGTMTFQGDISSFTSLLHAANILHIGRNSTLGFGQVSFISK